MSRAFFVGLKGVSQKRGVENESFSIFDCCIVKTLRYFASIDGLHVLLGVFVMNSTFDSSSFPQNSSSTKAGGTSFPDCFQPGDGGGDEQAAQEVVEPALAPMVQPPRIRRVSEDPPSPLVGEELIAYSSERDDVEATVREAEERLGRIREEEEALARRQAELTTFLEDKEEFLACYEETMERFHVLANELDQDGGDAQIRARAMAETAATLRYQLDRMDGIQPEQWSKDRMLQELDRALDQLKEFRRDYDLEMRRLAQELDRNSVDSKSRPVLLDHRFASFADKAVYAGKAALGFCLPLIAFGVVAAILILTALGGR